MYWDRWMLVIKQIRSCRGSSLNAIIRQTRLGLCLPPLHDHRTIGSSAMHPPREWARLSYPDAAATTPVRAMPFYPLLSMADFSQDGVAVPQVLHSAEK